MPKCKTEEDLQQEIQATESLETEHNSIFNAKVPFSMPKHDCFTMISWEKVYHYQRIPYTVW